MNQIFRNPYVLLFLSFYQIPGINVQFDKYGRRMGKRDFSSEFYQISFVTEEQIAEILLLMNQIFRNPYVLLFLSFYQIPHSIILSPF